MGQSHSTSSPKGAGTNEGEVGGKVDYYELLGVEQDASGEEIKKAYRKKALELHPDRNYGNVESATKLFAEVQSAYEILSDPQERAWYDSHRDAFLGSDGSPRGEDFSYNTRMTTCDDIFQMFSKFNPRMDFSDNETGFFGGLRETFTRLAVEERAASQWDHIDYIDYPAFGYRDDDFESTVRPFYAAWSGFSTRKSFAWKDIHRYSEAPDRRVRRLMEKENKRLREEGIREFNDAVRSLVAFVKKRDPRYRANAQSEAQRQEHLRQSVAAQAARSRAINNAKLREHVTPDWAKSEEADEDQDESSDTEMEHFECVVCHKNFKSQQQFEAHERSKKHTKAVKQLRWEMMAQDKQLNLDANENNSASSEADETRLRHSERSDFEPTPQSGGGINISNPNLDTFNSNETILQPNSQEVPSNASDSSMDSTLEHSQNWIPDADDGNADYAPRRLVEDRLHSELTPGPTADSDEIDSLSHHFSSVNVDKPPTAGKLGKAKQKRARKAAQQATEQPGGLKCATCNTLFPSKTQLFSHIRELDHARPLSNTAGAKGKMR